MNKRRDYYSILNLAADASPETIKSSYRALMQKVHPDLGGNQRDAAQINVAYAVLSDPSLRAQYDKLLGLARKPIASRSRTNVKGAAREKNSCKNKSTKAIPTNKEKLVCLFCKQTNIIAKNNPGNDELHCFVCQSPLRFIDFDPEWLGRRAARSTRQNVEIQYWINYNRNKTLSGLVEDLSPTGLRFSSNVPLRMGDILKISNNEISAVASVMRSEKKSGSYIAGVKFLSLKIHRARGTFVSQKV